MQFRIASAPVMLASLASLALHAGACKPDPNVERSANASLRYEAGDRIGPMRSPTRIALGTDGNVYVSDTRAGEVVILAPSGERIGSLDGFRRPLGVAAIGSGEATAAGTACEVCVPGGGDADPLACVEVTRSSSSSCGAAADRAVTGGGEACVALLAGGDVEVGEVCLDLERDADTTAACGGSASGALTVTVETAAPWQLAAAQLATAAAPDEFPTTKSGNPKIGHFAYQSGPIGGTRFAFSVPLCRLDLTATTTTCEAVTRLLAVHAELRAPADDGDFAEEGAWAAGVPFAERGSKATYFPMTWQCHPVTGTVAAGRIYVGDEGDGSVKFFDNGALAGHLGVGAGEFRQPNAIAVRSDGTVYVVDSKAALIKLYDADGAYLRSLPPLFDFPTDVAINEAAGEIYVTDFRWGDVTAFNMAGAWLRFMPGPLNAGGDPVWARPIGLGAGPHGELYVVDSMLNSVTVIDRTGHVLSAIGYRDGRYWTGELSVPVDAVSDGTRLFVTSNKAGSVNLFEVTP